MTDNYVKFISEQVHKEKVRGLTDVAIAEAHDHVSKTFTNHPDHGAVDHDVDDHEFAKDIMKRHGADVKVNRKDKNGKPVHAGGYVTHVTYSGPKASVASASREHREVAKEMRDEAN